METESAETDNTAFKTPLITPRLVVDDVAEAVAFYEAAFDATALDQFQVPSGKVVHAEMRVGDQVFSLTEHDPGINMSPTELGGSPLMLTLSVENADSVVAAFKAAGGSEIIPLDDRAYGYREGRFKDVSGHLWIISQLLEALSPDEIRRRMQG